MSNKIVSKDEWFTARKALLATSAMDFVRRHDEYDAPPAQVSTAA